MGINNQNPIHWPQANEFKSSHNYFFIEQLSKENTKIKKMKPGMAPIFAKIIQPESTHCCGKWGSITVCTAGLQFYKNVLNCFTTRR